MSPRPNASDGSAPEGPSAWQAEVIHRLGLLSRGDAAWGDVTCLDIHGSTLLLAPLKAHGPFPLEPGAALSLRFTGASGMLTISGVLAESGVVRVGGVAQDALRLEVEESGVRRLNRRQAYRVAVNLKGELVGLGRDDAPKSLRDSWAGQKSSGGASHLENLSEALSSRTRPCVVRDLSLGGARVSVASPAPGPGENALLHLSLAAAGGESLRDLPCSVVQSKSGALSPPFDALLRLRFLSLAPAVEGRLGRYIVKVQLEQLRTGVRG